MNHNWKKSLHFFMVLCLSFGMVFSLFQATATVTAEGEPADTGGVDTTEEENSNVSHNYSIEVKQDSEFCNSITMAKNSTSDPITVTVYDNGEVVENADWGYTFAYDDGNDIGLSFDPGTGVITSGEQYGYGRLVITYDDATAEVYVYVSDHYSIELTRGSESEFYGFINMTKNSGSDPIKVIVHDNLDNGEVVENANWSYIFEYDDGNDIGLSFDQSTGVITSGEQYGSGRLVITYEDATAVVYVNVTDRYSIEVTQGSESDFYGYIDMAKDSKSAPIKVRVIDNLNNGEEIENPELSYSFEYDDGNDIGLSFDPGTGVITSGEQYGYGRLVITYEDATAEVTVSVTNQYYIEVSNSNVVMGVQTKSDPITVTVRNRFDDGKEVADADYQVSYSSDASVTFDKETGIVTSYDQYGSYYITLTYEGASTQIKVNVVAPPTSLSFNTEEISLKVGNSLQLFQYLNIQPNEAYNCVLDAESSDPEVVTVSASSGSVYVDGQKAGEATVTVSAGDVSASVKVVVKEAGKASYIAFTAEGTYDYQTDLYLKSGDVVDLSTYLFDEKNNDITAEAKDEIEWSVRSYSSLASFNLDGNTLTATGCGEAMITASIGTGWRQTLMWEVYVADQDPESISFDKDTYNVHLQGYYYNNYVNATITPGVISHYSKYTITSNDTSIVEIVDIGRNSYYLKPVQVGTTTITAETVNGLTATATVVVDDGDFAQSIDSETMGKTISLKPGDTLKLEPVYRLSDGSTTSTKPADETVTYSIGDYYKQYLSIEQNDDGTANLKVLGYVSYAYVNATLSNGNSAYWNIQALPDVTSLHFSKSEYTATDENYLSLSNDVEILPTEAAGTSLAWYTSDPKIATVSEYGSINVIATGDVTITAASKDDNTIKDSVTVHCKAKADAPASITSSKGDTIQAYVGYNVWAPVTFEPDDSSIKANVVIDDPDGVVNLDQSQFRDGDMFYGLYIKGVKAGTATVTITSAYDASVQKVITINVSDNPTKEQLGFKYAILNGNGFDGDLESYIETNKNPVKYTFLKGGSYTLFVLSDYYPDGGYFDTSQISEDKNLPISIMGSGGSSTGIGYGIQANYAGTGTITLKTGDTIEYQVVDAIVNAPSVDTSSISDEALKEQVSNITNDSIGMSEALQNAASSLDISNNETIQAAANELKSGQELKVEITNVIKYESVEQTEESTKIVVSITPTYVVKVVDTEGNQVREVKTGEAEVNQSVSLSIPVNKELIGRTLYIRHLLQNGTSRIYEGTVDNDGNLNFINPDGFSTFEITAENPSTVLTATTGYTSLKDAISNGLAKDTITVTKDYDAETDITVSREMVFTLVNNSDQKFNITAGDGYTLSKGGDTYTVKANIQKEDDDTKPDWGKAVFTFSDDGKTATASRTNKNNANDVETVTATVTETSNVPPTCTTEGAVTYHAAAEFSDGTTAAEDKTVTLPPLGHTLNHVNAKAADIDVEGNIEYWLCETCGKYFTDAEGKNEVSADQVKIAAISVQSITLNPTPTKTEYYVGQELDPTDGKIDVVYSDPLKNQTGVEITKDMLTGDTSKAGVSTVTVTYGGKSATYEITVKERKAIALIYAVEPTDEEKTWPEEMGFHYAGKATVTYDSGDVETVDISENLFAVDGYDANLIGAQTVTLKFKANEALTLTENIIITQKQQTGISAQNVTITIGSLLTMDMFKAELLYNNGTEVDTNNISYNFTEPEFSIADIIAGAEKQVLVTVRDNTSEYTTTVTVTVKPVVYDLTDGDQSVVSVTAGKDQLFRSTADLSKFKAVLVDGAVVDPANYDVKSGSTIVTLKASYLATLANGDHTIMIVSSDGKATGTFKVTESTVSKDTNTSDGKKKVVDTGDHTNVGLFGGLLFFSICAIAAILYIRRKKA